MFSGIFKTRANKQFNYTPRHIKDSKVKGIKFGGRMTDREHSDSDIRNAWREARFSGRANRKSFVNLRIVIIIALLTIVAVLFLDIKISDFIK